MDVPLYWHLKQLERAEIIQKNCKYYAHVPLRVNTMLMFHDA